MSGSIFVSGGRSERVTGGRPVGGDEEDMAVTFCSLINRKLDRKSSQLACSFTSSLTFVQNPFVSHVKNVKKSTFSNPFELMRGYDFSGQHSAWNTQVLQAHLLKTRDLQSDVFSMNSLLRWYCKSADMVVANKLFDTIALPNVVSWNVMISGYDHNLMFEKSLEMFCMMH